MVELILLGNHVYGAMFVMLVARIALFLSKLMCIFALAKSTAL